jgi:hypothetical protein
MKHIAGMSIKMVKEKELELEYLQELALNIMENGILMREMAVERRKILMGTAIEEIIRMIEGKGMGHMKLTMEADISGSTGVMPCTGTGYTDGLMERYITENGNKMVKMDMDITSGQMAMNIAVSSKMIRNRERACIKRRECSTETNMSKTNA